MTTEGDAFQFVFHHATDAVAYAVAAQQALLTAKWPLELETHYRTRSRGLNDPCSSEDAELGNTACPGANLSLLPHAQNIFKILPASMLSNQTFTNLARWQSILLLEFSVCALSKIYLYWPSLMTSTRCSCLLIPQPVLTRYN